MTVDLITKVNFRSRNHVTFSIKDADIIVTILT